MYKLEQSLTVYTNLLTHPFECNGYTLSVSNDISTDNLAQIMKATLK